MLVALGLGIVLIAQIPLAIGLLDPDVVFEAGHAKGTLVVNAVLAALTIALAAFVPRRWRAVALLPGAAVCGAMLVASVTFGGHLVDSLVGLATFAAAWWVGRVLLARLRVPALTGIVVIELVLGLAMVGLGVFALGRMGILAWWNVGVLVVALGAVGVWVAARQTWAVRRSLAGAITGSPIAVACAGLLLLQMGWAVVWLSAPEIMYDALSTKSYLPEIWAQSGDIGPLLAHPILNTTGLSQIVAIPGHVLHGPDIGRDLQLLAWITIASTVWWFGRRSVAGPLAALAVGLVPQLVWESTTAYDDLMIALGAIALAIAVLRTVGARTVEPPLGAAITIGLLAGSCIWLKLHIAVVAIVLSVGWVLLAGPLRGVARRFAGVLAGGTVVFGPSLIVRWIDTGNPVFPAYNDVFRSPYAYPVNETFNFPFRPTAGIWDAIKLPYDAIVTPSLMVEVVPAGGFGLLVAAVVLAALLGWRRPASRGVLLLWGAIIIGLLAWWIQFRYLRYVVPMALISVLLVLTMLRGWSPGRATSACLLVAAGLASAAYLPSTVATFWNVPNRDVPYAAAFGRWDEHDYLKHVFFELPAVDAFVRLSPKGAVAISGTHVRPYLHGRDVTPSWEILERLQLKHPLTTPADTRARLGRLGIDWALLNDPDRGPQGTPWIHELLQRYGKVEFEEGSWTLFRLEDRPVPSTPNAR